MSSGGGGLLLLGSYIATIVAITITVYFMFNRPKRRNGEFLKILKIKYRLKFKLPSSSRRNRTKNSSCKWNCWRQFWRRRRYWWWWWRSYWGQCWGCRSEDRHAASPTSRNKKNDEKGYQEKWKEIHGSCEDASGHFSSRLLLECIPPHHGTPPLRTPPESYDEDHTSTTRLTISDIITHSFPTAPRLSTDRPIPTPFTLELLPDLIRSLTNNKSQGPTTNPQRARTRFVSMVSLSR